MGKKTNTAEADRYAAAEEEARLREYLERSGPEAIHSVKSIAQVLFGCDGPVLPRQRKHATRWAQRLRRYQYPLMPCDEEGTVLSDEEANARAARGIARRWRYYPDGRWVREFGETLDAEGRAALADGLVALEESESPPVFDEPRERILEGIRSIVSLHEYREAKRRFAAARATLERHRASLVNQLSRTTLGEQSDVGRRQHSGDPAVAKDMMQSMRKWA